MGLCKSTLLNDSAVVAGSTVISGGSVMILGDSLLLPIRDQQTNKSSVAKIDLKERKVRILRGVAGSSQHD